MAGDLHLHRARVNFAQPRVVSANSPDAIDFVPGTLVAEHNQSRIDRRELNVVEPVSRVMKGLQLAALDIDRIERHRQVRRQPPLHHLAFAWIAVGPRARCGARRRWRGVLGSALDKTAGQQRLVGIDCEPRAGAQFGLFDDGSGLARVQMSGINRPVFEVEDLARLPADDEVAGATIDQFFDLARLEVYRGDAAWSRDHHLVALGGVRVLVKIEAGAAGFTGEADYAMAGRRIDPFNRRL